MFSKSIIAVAALAGSAVAAPISSSALPAAVTAPAGWQSGYLEDYQVYHARYLAIGCKDHVSASGSDEYFQTCCQPILANQTLSEVRPVQCIPSNEAAENWAAGVVATETAVDSAAVSAFVAEASSVAEGVSNITATATADLAVVTYANATLTVLSAPAATSTAAAVEASSSEEAAAPVTSASPSSTYEEPSSTYVAPTSTYVAPTSTYVAPTSTYVAPTTEAPVQTQAAAATNNGGDWKYGQATFYYQNGAPGACGDYSPDSLPLVALPASYWNWNGGSSPSQYCGKYIQVTRGDRSVTAVVKDLCPTCVGADSIDLSTGAFDQIASESEGSVPVSWKFL